MTVSVRIPSGLLALVRKDLARPHAFAFERVGHLFVRPAGNGGVILFADYLSVPDEDYLPDESVGAKVSGTVIRSVMQRILSREEGAFHVHVHEGCGPPAFSRVDRLSLAEVVPSFQAVGPTMPHGAMLLSNDFVVADVWMPGCRLPKRATAVTSVGFPLEQWKGKACEQ